MVLANGKIVKASKDENVDLFYGAASAFGTLGVTTLLEIQLIPARTYVVLSYHPVSNIVEAQAEIDNASKDLSTNYIDGIMFSKISGVICVGRLTNDVPTDTKIQKFTRPTDPWFYLHVQKLMKHKKTTVTEAIPVTDYLFRYDRGGFWVARYAYTYFLTPFNRITRYLLNSLMHTRVMYHALHQSGMHSAYIIQDVAIPYTQAETFMNYLDTNFEHYPIWLCPLKQSGIETASTHSLQVMKTNKKMPETMLNFGVWGPGPTKHEAFVSWNRAFERMVDKLGGQKWLYAHAYYTEEEFDQIYNRRVYDVLREKYHAGYLPSVYDKVKVDVRRRNGDEGVVAWLVAMIWRIWPLMGLYGVYKAWRGGEYLLPEAGRRRVGRGDGVKQT